MNIAASDLRAQIESARALLADEADKVRHVRERLAEPVPSQAPSTPLLDRMQSGWRDCEFLVSGAEIAENRLAAALSEAIDRLGEAQAAIRAAPATAIADLGERAIGYAETTMAASVDMAQRLLRARDVQEMLQIQAEFVQKQIATLAAQAEALDAAAQRLHGDGDTAVR
jgi:hypothetical protein